MGRIKCLVTDLDDTLWDGKILEVEAQGVKPYDGRINVLRELDSRGILLSIVSRGDYKLAMEALKKFGIEDLFLVPQINLNPKYINIETIAATLSLGLDSFAFVDNEGEELVLMQEFQPEVLTIPAQEYHLIPSNPRFEGGATEESRNRRLLYQGMLEERDLQQRLSPSSTILLVPGLETRVQIQIAAQDDLPRLRELVERTHQLNFSGNNYNEEALKKIYSDPTKDIYVISVRNEITDYGRSGICIIDKSHNDYWYAQDLLFSCRILGKSVEAATIAYLLQEAQKQGVPQFVVFYRPTERNRILHQTIGTLDYSEERLLDGNIHYKFNTSQPGPKLVNISME